MNQLELREDERAPKEWHILVSNVDRSSRSTVDKRKNKKKPSWHRLVPMMRQISNENDWHVLEPLEIALNRCDSRPISKENDFKSLEIHQFYMDFKENEETQLEQKQKLLRLKLQLKRLHYENEYLENENTRLLDEKRLLVEIKCLYKEFLLPEDSDYSLKNTTTLTKEFSDVDDLGSLGSSEVSHRTDTENTADISESVLKRYNSITGDATNMPITQTTRHLYASLSSTKTTTTTSTKGGDPYVSRNEKNKRDGEEIFKLKKEIVMLLMRNEELMKENEVLRGDRDCLIHKKSFYKQLLES